MSRTKVEYRSAGKEVYNDFCIKHPSIRLTFKEWEKIIYTFNGLFRDYILDTGEVAKLPWGVGAFSISKKKPRKTKTFEDKEYMNMPIDWQKTRKAGKYIYNFNSHTDGYRCRWYWFSQESRFENVDIWNFKACRRASRGIKEYLKRPQQLEVYKQWERR